MFSRLPGRFSRAALLRNFPRASSARLVGAFSLANARVKEVTFVSHLPVLCGEAGSALTDATAEAQAQSIRAELRRFFQPAGGFGPITRINDIDGVRVCFDNGDVAHFRPSGNADELRIYAVADTQERAEAIAQLGVAEPGGILRRMEAATAVMRPAQ